MRMVGISRFFLNGIEYKAVAELSLEVHTICCHDLSAKHFLRNNDINVTASCLYVEFSKDDLYWF